MPTPIKASELRFGLEASPGFQGNRLAPYELVNAEINSEGRSVLRKGYINSDQAFVGQGDQLAVVHFVRDRYHDGNSVYKRLGSASTHAVYGRRLFIADPTDRTQNIWIDADTNIEYIWELPKPTIAPTLDLDISQQGDAGIVAVEVTPNPFTQAGGNVRIAVASETRVKVEIYALAGPLIKIVSPENPVAVDGHNGYFRLAAGNHTFSWDGRNELAEQAAAGLYFPTVTYLNDSNVGVVFDIQKAGLLAGNEDEEEEQFEVDEIIDGGDLVRGTGFRGGVYAIVYTYYSSKHGIETAPSPISQVRIVASTNPNREDRIIADIDISGYSANIPYWANQVRFYAKRLGNITTIREAQDIPYDFTYIGGPAREELPGADRTGGDTINPTWTFRNERAEEPFDYLRTKEFYVEPDQRGLQSIVSYAGRIWGYDADLHSIRFSHIDRPDVMPYDDQSLPHAIRIDGSWNARVQAIHVIPPSGGLYVFFPRAIRTVRGQQILTGIFQLTISPETDIDASGGVNGKGTRSPHTITSFGSLTFYLDTDRRIYSLGGDHALQTEEMSLSIQPFLDEASDENIRNARAEIWQSRYHLMLSDRTYILDLQRNYWTIWDVPIKSILHSVGGDGDEDILYALVDNRIVELYNGDAPDDTEWMWVTNYIDLPRYSRVSEVVLPHPEVSPPTFVMRIETERGMTDWQEYQPSAGDKFRLGTFAQADTRVRVYIRGTGEIPRFNELFIGVN